MELLRVTHFRLLYNHMMYITIHDVGLSATVAAENNRITFSKESATETFSNLEDGYLFYL